MAEDWSAAEVAATVGAYFEMLTAEIRGEAYSKAESNRRLRASLSARSRAAVEFKHANISAVLLDLGLPYIEGYKPRANYQLLLREEVEAALAAESGLVSAVQSAVEAPARPQSLSLDLDELIVPVPRSKRADSVYERPGSPVQPTTRINYLEKEALNASLGAAGELFALELEHRRLWLLGAKKLARRIEHVSRTRGDGLGYDILSFDSKGRERLVEVKTTRFGVYTPFFASRNEVDVSSNRSDSYAVYRVFDFHKQPRLFIVEGSLRESFRLDAVQYKASVA